LVNFQSKITGTGTTNTIPKFTGASTIGNSNVSDNGTLITLGSNTTISSGGLGIGSTNIGGANGNLNIGKTITGSVDSVGVNQQGIVLSDSTNTANGFYNILNTQATSFTIGTYFHFRSAQGTIGAGSAVTTQVGFLASSGLIGATNNYGFRGAIPVGTNRWNLYMDGTAANYLAGDTGIGTQTLGTATQLTIGGTETAVSAISRGQLINTTLVASANGDTLVGLDINPTFTNGAFTGVRNYWLQLVGNGAINGTNQILLLRAGLNVFSASSVETNVSSSAASLPLKFSLNSNATTVGQFFGTTGNFTLQNGGTFTDAGFRLDVNGTTRFIGTASSDTAPLGAELAAVTGTGTNWTLAGTNLNVGGYTHTTGSVVPLTTALAAVNGTYYQIAYTITGRTAGSITIAYGGTSTTVSATGASGPLASSTAVLTITPTTDFDGTVVLSIKTISTSAASSTFSTSASTSNIEVRASSAANNTFIGLQTGRRNTTGTSNTFIGVIAGRENTTGSDNTFIGTGSGQINTISGSNTFVGAFSGQANTTGSENTFLGRSAGQNNTTGTLNTFVGRQAGLGSTTAANNTAIGQSTLLANTTQSGLTAIGASALQTNSTGSLNSAVGFAALRQNTTGSNNTAFGYATMQNNTTGSSNVAIGTNAGRYIANGSTDATIISNSIFIGSQAYPLADSQSNQIVIGSGTIGLGTNTTIIGNSSTVTTALYGDLLLGTTTPSTATILTVSGTETASSAIARGGLINTTLVASANGDTLVGLDINSTPSVGAFTGVQYSALRVNGNVLLNANSINIVVSPNGTGTTNESLQFNAGRAIFGYDATIGGAYVGTYAARPISFLLGTSTMGRFFATTGNLTLQNGGTYTDIPTARLAVNSTTQGFLPPRMTTTQKLAIATPAAGLMVYDTTLNQMSYYNGTIWINF